MFCLNIVKEVYGKLNFSSVHAARKHQETLDLCHVLVQYVIICACWMSNISLISVVVFQVEWWSEPGRDVAAYRPSHNISECKLTIPHAEKLLYSWSPIRPRCLGQELHPRGPCPQKRASLRPTLGASSGKRRRPLQPAVGRTREGPRTLEAALPLPLGSFSSCRPSIRTPPLSWHRPRTSMDQIK